MIHRVHLPSNYSLRARCFFARCFRDYISPGKSDLPLVVHLLETCTQSKSLIEGKKIHQYLLKNHTGKGINSVLLEKLAHLYINCCQVQLARHVFDEIPDPSVVLCDMMVRAYAWNGPLGGAIDMYGVMLESGIGPTKYTFPFVLKACSGLQALRDGKQIHAHAVGLGFGSDVFVSTALIDLYAKCGCLMEAQRAFNSMAYKDVVAWNAMIAGFSFHGLHDEVMGLVVEMQEAGTAPNSSTAVSVLPAIAQANVLSQGKALHGYCLRKSFCDDVVIATGLLDMYGKCQCLAYARRVFDNMVLRNEVTWSAMMNAYLSCNFACKALALFDQMMHETAAYPNRVTVGCILQACAKLADLSSGRKLHCYALKSGLLLDIMVGNTLLSMYSKCGNTEGAVSFFNEMSSKDAVSYNAIISGWVQSGNAKEALVTFCKMRHLGYFPELATMVGLLSACSHLAALRHGTCCHCYSIAFGFAVDTLICNTLIDMYSKCGQIKHAKKVFDKMSKRDVVSWNVMILGYGINGLGMQAVSLFQSMHAENKIKPDDVTFTCLLLACSHSGLIAEGKHWFDAMSGEFSIVPKMEHYICMTDLIGRAGHLMEAHNFILQMPMEADVRVWSALLSACRIHKNLELSEEISQIIKRLETPKGTGSFVLMSNIYSAAGRWAEAAHVRVDQRNSGLRKFPGCSQLT